MTDVSLIISSARFGKIYEVHKFTEYSIDLELETDADAFNFTISNPGGVYTGIFNKYDDAIIRINGQSIMKGNIDCVEYSWDDASSRIRIDGRDMMNIMVDNDAIPGTHKNVRPYTYITDKCNEYGIKASVDSSLNAIEQLIIGCGESEVSIINNIAMDSRKRVWFEFDTLHVGDWNDSAQPTYLFTRGIKHRPGIPIKRLTLREDGTDTKSEIRIYGSNNDGAEKVVGTAENDYMIHRGIRKRMVKRSSNNDSVTKYSANALRDIRDSFRENIEIEIEVKTDAIILPNKTAQIIDTITKVNAVFFITGVSYSKDINNGSITKITMIPSETAFDVIWQTQQSTSGSFTGTPGMTLADLIAQRKG